MNKKSSGAGDENDEEGDFEDEPDSGEKNDPEIAEGTDVLALTPTSHKAATELEKEKMEGSHLNQRSGERKMHREKSQYALFNLLPQGHVVLKLMAMIARCDLGVELPIEEVPLLLLRLHVVLMED
ncbi:hypothetical protein U1Q18_036257 [Sarracenia purpurea var. burkii]